MLRRVMAVLASLCRARARWELGSKVRAHEYNPGPVCWQVSLLPTLGSPGQLADELLKSGLSWYWTAYDVPLAATTSPAPVRKRDGPFALTFESVSDFRASFSHSRLVDLYALSNEQTLEVPQAVIANWLDAFRAGMPSPIVLAVEEMAEPGWKIVCMARDAPEAAVALLEAWGTGPRKTKAWMRFVGPMEPLWDSFTPPLR